MKKRCYGEEMKKREKKLRITMESAKTLKRQRCTEHGVERVAVGSSVLEALPQEILIKIASRVNHEDLRQLIHVSKAIHEAVIAKESRFVRTPSETMRWNSDEAPPAPKRLRMMNWVRIGKNMPQVPLFVDEEQEEQRC